MSEIKVPQIIIQMPAEEKAPLIEPEIKQVAMSPIAAMFWALLLLVALWYVSGGWEVLQR